MILFFVDDEAELEQLLVGLHKPSDESKRFPDMLTDVAAMHMQKGLVAALSSSITDLNRMIARANGVFSALSSLEVNFDSLYTKVKDFIRLCAIRIQATNTQGRSLEELKILCEEKKSHFEEISSSYDEALSSLNDCNKYVKDLEKKISDIKATLKNLEEDFLFGKEK